MLIAILNKIVWRKETQKVGWDILNSALDMTQNDDGGVKYLMKMMKLWIIAQEVRVVVVAILLEIDCTYVATQKSDFGVVVVF